MSILIFNTGSSSIKFSLYTADLTLLAEGAVEKISESLAVIQFEQFSATPCVFSSQQQTQVTDHTQALWLIFDWLNTQQQLTELALIGHRVVHGGTLFQQAVFITPAVIEQIYALSSLAPLHNPANLLAIELVAKTYPDLPQVAVFDTAFYHTLPDYAYHYPLPLALQEQQQIRRYGFHGTSHAYCLQQAAHFLRRPADKLNLITLHLGNGASISAIQQGRAVDTSMGMTPLAGLMMGTRCGDIDPAIFWQLQQSGLSADEIKQLYYYESGLKGICGENDMRAIHAMIAEGDDKAQLAFTMFCYQISKYIGSYFAVLGAVDALVFTGGIGEHDAEVRTQVCQNLAFFGVVIDEAKNNYGTGELFGIQAVGQALKILVLHADEQKAIATQALTLQL